MGNYFGSEQSIPDRSTPRKRKRNQDNIDSEEKLMGAHDDDLLTPRRKKLKTTSKYIYDTFFVNGTNSDITITALCHTWKLHKVYLKQSGYFSSMLSGNWRESNQNQVDILIPDPNIDKKALDVAFGSLYQDDVTIKPCRVISILAAATLLQLDGLIQHCIETMEDTISALTVCSYHTAAAMYGTPTLTRSCVTWLERNIMTTQSASLLRAVKSDLMTSLIDSPDLYVMQVEMDVYTMLKKWLFLQLNAAWCGPSKQLGHAAEQFLTNDDNRVLLRSPSSRELMNVFAFVRLRHIINDIHSANFLESDNLIPKSWLRPLYYSQWHQMLAMDQGVDKGPTDQVDHDLFLRESLRCGRVLQNEGDYCWRWTGYNYGTDLLVTYAHRLIIVKRNTQTLSSSLSISLEPKRKVMLRCSVVSFDQDGRPKYHKSSGIMTLSLSRDGEAIIMTLDRNAKFPLHISMNLLFYTPDLVRRQRVFDVLDEHTLQPSAPPHSERQLSEAVPCGMLDHSKLIAMSPEDEEANFGLVSAGASVQERTSTSTCGSVGGLSVQGRASTSTNGSACGLSVQDRASTSTNGSSGGLSVQGRASTSTNGSSGGFSVQGRASLPVRGRSIHECASTSSSISADGLANHERGIAPSSDSDTGVNVPPHEADTDSDADSAS